MTRGGRLLGLGRLRTTVALGLVAVALAPAAQAATDPPLQSYAEVAPMPPYEQTLQQLELAAQTVCPQSAPKGKTPSLRTAVQRATRIARQGAGAKGARAFKRSPDSRSAPAAGTAAAGAVIAGKPHAALLALLRAHQLEPKKAAHLVNAGSLVDRLGDPLVALALLDAAAKRRPGSATAMGIGGKAILQNNRAHALFGLKRFGAAEKLLRRVVGSAPLLSEAKLNLAAVLLCQGKVAEAAPVFRAGQYRNTYDAFKPGPPTPPTPGDETPPAEEEFVPPGEESFDLSGGVEGSFPDIRYPEHWTQNYGRTGEAPWDRALEEWRAREDHFNQRLNAAREQVTALHLKSSAAEPHSGGLDPATFTRLDRLIPAAWNPSGHPRLRPLDAQIAQTRRDLRALVNGYDQALSDLRDESYTWPECCEEKEARWQSRCAPLNDDWYDRFRAVIHAADTQWRNFHREAYRYGTALAAHVGHPVLHEYVLTGVQANWVGYYALLSHARGWATHLGLSSCDGETPAPEVKASEGATPAPEPCAKFLRGVKFSIKFGDFFKLSSNCEELSGELASKAWIGPFVESAVNFRKATTTVVVGVKQSLKLPGSNVGVSAKEGVYVTVGNTGIQDAGVRIKTSGSFGLHPAGAVDLKGPGVQISYVSGVKFD